MALRAKSIFKCALKKMKFTLYIYSSSTVIYFIAQYPKTLGNILILRNIFKRLHWKECNMFYVNFEVNSK